jgi:hypothetical protein
MSATDAIPEWLTLPGPDDQWRIQFGEKNSWASRAARVVEILGGPDA